MNQAPPVPARGAVGVGAAALVVCALPDDTLRLLDPSGAPMALAALVNDPGTSGQVLVSVPAALRHAPPMASAIDPLLFWWLAPLALFAVLASRVDPDPRWAKAARAGLAVVGALLVAVAVSGLAQLLGGTVTLPDAASWATDLTERAGGALGVDLADPTSSGAIGWRSRPMIDALRLVVGVAAVGLALRWPPARKVETRSPLPYLPLAVGLLAIAAASASASASSLALGAAVLFGLGGWVLSAVGSPTSRGAADLLALSAVAFGWSVIAPLAGWAPG